MKTALFDYILPPEKIAQHPIKPRDASKLLIISQGKGEGKSVPVIPAKAGIHPWSQIGSCLRRSEEDKLSEMIFRDIHSLFRAWDLLVINTTRVMPARIRGKISLKPNKKAQSKEQKYGFYIWNELSTNNQVLTTKIIECLFLRSVSPDVWEIMCFPGERLKTGREIILENWMILEIVGETYAGRLVHVPVSHHEWLEILKKYGEIPLPPYIVEKLANSELYQTVYSKVLGSTASPTAGRHFTPELLARIRAKGVEIAEVTLHIGPGTFKPIYEDVIEDYQIHSEFVTIPAETIAKIQSTKKRGGRIIAVGTTSVRSLESLAVGKLQPSFRTNESSKGGEWRFGIQDITMQSEQNITGMDPRVNPEDDGHQTGYSGNTDLYITPGFDFQLVDVMITNFHAPRTSLLVLVAAFMGLENMQAAYQYALEHDFRFLSFGDVMWVERRSS